MGESGSAVIPVCCCSTRITIFTRSELATPIAACVYTEMERTGSSLNRDLARSRANTSEAFRIGSSGAPYKIVLAGIAGVGKTSLLERVRSGRFLDKDPWEISTIGRSGTDRHTIKTTVDVDTITVCSSTNKSY